MQLGELETFQRFKVVGWENGPIFTVRMPPNDPFKLIIYERGKRYAELNPKDFVVVDQDALKESGEFRSLSEIVKTTHMFPVTTKVELVSWKN